MSCTDKIASMNIVTTREPCSGDCSFSFDYNNNSSCVVTINDNYLDIKTDGTNSVSFKGIQMGVVGSRLYQPSLHLFDGKQVDAELIIQHSGGGTNLLVCIPIKAGSSSGSSTDFFQAFLPYISSSEDGAQSIQVTQWSLNSVVPQGPYYFYIGPFPYPPCSGNNSIIVFDGAQSATMSASSLTNLKAMISPSSPSNASQTSTSTPNLYYNGTGSVKGTGTSTGSTDETLTCSILSQAPPKQTLNWDNPWTSPMMIFLYCAIAIGVVLIFFTLMKKVFGAGAVTAPSLPNIRSPTIGTKLGKTT